jgi:hypothetical protein
MEAPWEQPLLERELPIRFAIPQTGPYFPFHYVMGLTAADPEDWIVAYHDPAAHDDRVGVLLFKSGEAKIVKTAAAGGDFERQLATFVKAYEAARGEPPVILPPE